MVLIGKCMDFFLQKKSKKLKSIQLKKLKKNRLIQKGIGEQNHKTKAKNNELDNTDTIADQENFLISSSKKKRKHK